MYLILGLPDFCPLRWTRLFAMLHNCVSHTTDSPSCKLTKTCSTFWKDSLVQIQKNLVKRLQTESANNNKLLFTQANETQLNV